MKVGIFGSAAGSDKKDILEKARELGRELAKRGHTIITGGCIGMPQEVVLGANEAGGKCIAFSPAVDLESHLKDPAYTKEGFSDFVFIPKDYEHVNNPAVCKKYRNVSSCAAVDVGIIVGGRIGTMNEFTNLYDMGKDIGILEGTGGITKSAIEVLQKEASKKSCSRIVRNSNPVALIKELLSESSR